MSNASAMQNYDRRSSPRTDINSPVILHLPEDITATVEMLNISHTGLCIASADLIEAPQLKVVMESEDQFEGAIEITAEIVRSERFKETQCYVYGCRIQEISGF